MSDAKRRPLILDPGRTHYEGCWHDPGHHACAVTEIERLRTLLADRGQGMESGDTNPARGHSGDAA